MVSKTDYVFNLVRFAFRANRLLYASIAVSLVSVGVELLAMSSLFPLFQIVSSTNPPTNGIIARALLYAGFGLTAATLLWTFIGLIALRIVTQLIGQSLSMYLGKRVLAQLGSRAFEQIIHKLSIQEINEKSIGFYIGLAGDESFRASTLVISLTQFASTAALALLYFGAIAAYSLVTAGIVLIFLLCSCVALAGVLRASHRLGIRQTVESRKAHSIFLDSLNNLKTVRAFSAEGYVAGLYRAVIFGYTRILFLIDEIALLARLVPILLLLVIFGLWLAFATQPIEGVGLAFIVTMIIYLMRFLPTIGEGARLLFKIVSDAKSGRDVTAILGAQASNESNLASLVGEIQSVNLSGVKFSYMQDSENTVLRGVDLKLGRRKSYAIVGRSGIGKSTLIDLLLKFYAPTGGQVLINDTPFSSVADTEIRKRIVLVSQESAIFDDTIWNNICLGLCASAAELHHVCQIACVDEIIESMPEGFQARLQYQGKNLSGGQRQRIAIARALLRRPDVLILDESTSALDKKMQDLVIGNILREYADKIVILVTHDPRVIELVDEVIDLEQMSFNTVSTDGQRQVGSSKRAPVR